MTENGNKTADANVLEDHRCQQLIGSMAEIICAKRYLDVGSALAPKHTTGYPDEIRQGLGNR